MRKIQWTLKIHLQTYWKHRLELSKDKRAQREMTLCEFKGAEKAIQSIRGELANILEKLSDLDKEIAKEKQKYKKLKVKPIKRRSVIDQQI